MFNRTTAIPQYFYSLQAITDEGRPRWIDEFADPYEHVLTFQDFDVARARLKRERNEAYSKWIASFFRTEADGTYTPLLKGKQMKWQAVQAHGFKHDLQSERDWWEFFQDGAQFRVFMQPETLYDERSKDWRQYYLLCPEDSYLVNRWEIMRKGAELPPRDYSGHEKYLSADKRLRRARLIPTQCARHLRHDTTRGELPIGL